MKAHLLKVLKQMIDMDIIKDIIEPINNKELQRLVKLQSIIEDTDNSIIIERAIESYVSKEAHSINEQIKKKR